MDGCGSCDERGWMGMVVLISIHRWRKEKDSTYLMMLWLVSVGARGWCMGNVEVEAYIIYLCAFAQPQSHQLSKSRLMLSHPPPSASTVSTMCQWPPHMLIDTPSNIHQLACQQTPLPPPRQHMPLPLQVSMDTNPVGFLFIFLHSQSVHSHSIHHRPSYPTCPHASHPHMRPISMLYASNSGTQGKVFYMCKYY